MKRPARPRRRIAAGTALLLVAAVTGLPAVVSGAMAAPVSDAPAYVCHDNGTSYVKDASGIQGHLSGHRRDIVPPYSGKPAGVNWTTAGQAVWAANCRGATPTVVTATPDKVTICHRTHATTNPYRRITVAASAVDGVGTSDHTQHSGVGAAFDPTHEYAPSAKVWDDVIPDATGGGIDPGLHWTLGGETLFTAYCEAMTAQSFAAVELTAGRTIAEVSADLLEQAAEGDPTTTEAIATVVDAAAVEVGLATPTPSATDTSAAPDPTDTSAAPDPTDTSAAPDPSTSSADPDPTTSSADPDPTTSSADPDPATSSADPDPTTSSADPDPTTSSADPDPSESSADPDPSESSADPEPSTSSADPDPTESSADPDPSESSADPDPSTSSADPDPSESSADPDPTTSSAPPSSPPATSAAGSGRLHVVVFLDSDGDGVQGPDEPGLAGATLLLTGPDGQRTVETDQDGVLDVTDLPAGTWDVVSVHVDGLELTGDSSGRADGVARVEVRHGSTARAWFGLQGSAGIELDASGPEGPYSGDAGIVWLGPDSLPGGDDLALHVDVVDGRASVAGVPAGVYQLSVGATVATVAVREGAVSTVVLDDVVAQQAGTGAATLPLLASSALCLLIGTGLLMLGRTPAALRRH